MTATATYIYPDDYMASPPSTLDEIREEHRIAVGWLRSEIADRDARIRELERYVGELLREIAGIE